MNSHKTDHPARYVIQRHLRGTDLHWDFMLESGDCLWTWRIDMPPEQVAHAPANATRIADHPLRFLTYEGPVNKGAGTVAITDSGTFSIVAQSPHGLEFRLHGQVLQGAFRLDELAGANWRLAPANSPNP